MSMTRKEPSGTKAYTTPLLGIALLLVSYLLLADWHEVPALIDYALASVPWPS